MSTEPRLNLAGLVLDLDGTLYEADAPIAGAAEAIAVLRDAGIQLRFVTNTSRKPKRQVQQTLRQQGIAVELDELFTAPAVAAAWLRERGLERVALCIAPETMEDFTDFTADEESPQAVVVGDLGRAWTFDRLNQAFRWVLGGADIVAIQKNRYWKTGSGLDLDAGPFVAALEYATGKTATVVGKPSRAFFAVAVRSMGLAEAAVAMVGDDLANDVGGAQAAGLTGILVRTGKFTAAELERSDVTPDLVIGSVAELPRACSGVPGTQAW